VLPVRCLLVAEGGLVPLPLRLGDAFEAVEGRSRGLGATNCCRAEYTSWAALTDMVQASDDCTASAALSWRVTRKRAPDCSQCVGLGQLPRIDVDHQPGGRPGQACDCTWIRKRTIGDVGAPGEARGASERTGPEDVGEPREPLAQPGHRKQQLNGCIPQCRGRRIRL
jgi:hypothetical protein